MGETTYEVWKKLLKALDGLTLIPAETFFKNTLSGQYRELEPWTRYMAERYSFLR